MARAGPNLQDDYLKTKSLTEWCEFSSVSCKNSGCLCQHELVGMGADLCREDSVTDGTEHAL